MLSILFCDDDPFFLGLIRTLADDILTAGNLSARCIGTVSHPEEALRLRKQYPGECVVFLDLDFGSGKLCGIDIARSLRSLPDTRIVYVTNHRERAMEILQSGTEPYGFLEKSTDLPKLASGIRRYLCMAAGGSRRTGTPEADTVTLRLGDETVVLPRCDILYLETEKRISHGITYHTSGGSVLTVIGTMEAQLQKLGPDFMRVHRSYIVQRIHTAALRKGELILSDGTRIPCSPSLRGEVKAWLREN